MENTTTANTVTSIAACVDHLNRLLDDLVPVGETKNIRLSNVEEPDELYNCDCGKPAHWYARDLRPAELAR